MNFINMRKSPGNKGTTKADQIRKRKEDDCKGWPLAPEKSMHGDDLKKLDWFWFGEERVPGTKRIALELDKMDKKIVRERKLAIRRAKIRKLLKAVNPQ